MPLLWVLRDVAGLTGTKFGCGIGQCGACTVHLNGAAVRSCVVPLSGCSGKSVVTIEALGATEKGAALQRAWVAEQVPQCGYCQPGQLMAAAAVIDDAKSGEEAAASMNNLCRCGTYLRIRRAMDRVVRERQKP